MALIRQMIQSLLNLFGLNLQIALWKCDAEFIRLLKQTRRRRLVSAERSFMLWQLAKSTAFIEGDMAEVGVYKGGSAKIIAGACPEKKKHFFDTFTGIPGNTPEVDFYKKGDFAGTSLDSVKSFLEDCQNVYFYSGCFPGSAQALSGKNFCFVHVDVDVYESVRGCLEFFYPKMSRGGVMLFDDWQWKGCPGVKKAVEGFLKDKPEKPVVTASFQCAIIKR